MLGYRFCTWMNVSLKSLKRVIIQIVFVFFMPQCIFIIIIMNNNIYYSFIIIMLAWCRAN